MCSCTAGGAVKKTVNFNMPTQITICRLEVEDWLTAWRHNYGAILEKGGKKPAYCFFTPKFKIICVVYFNEELFTYLFWQPILKIIHLGMKKFGHTSFVMTNHRPGYGGACLDHDTASEAFTRDLFALQLCCICQGSIKCYLHMKYAEALTFL